MEQLPAEIVMDILVRLPVKSVMNCRCVSKSWLQLTHQPNFIQMHLNRTLSLQQPHRNFLISNFTIACNTLSTPLFTLEYNETLRDYTCGVVGFSESQPNFVGFRVMGSCNGLVCLVGCDDYQFGKIYVSNPFTRYCVKLPDPVGYSYDTAVGFGFSPEMNQYKVVTIRNVYDEGWSDWAVVSVCTLGDSSWRVLETIQHKVNWEICPKQVFVNGALHWLSRGPANVFISIDVSSEVVRVIPLPNVSFRDCPSLGVLDGCLSFTGFVYPTKRAEIWVMKEYGVRESWNKCYCVDFNCIRRNNKGLVRTICLQEDGELLMLYRLRDLVSYNVKTMSLRKITFVEPQLPAFFEVINHVPSLVSPINIEGII